MLSSYRVLDLSGQRGMFCAYVLSHLGADVVAIEPPKSCVAESGSEGDPDFRWQAYSRRKRNVCIDFESDRFRELVLSADFSPSCPAVADGWHAGWWASTWSASSGYGARSISRPATPTTRTATTMTMTTTTTTTMMMTTMTTTTPPGAAAAA